MDNILIDKRESKRYPGLFVTKYKRKVFYDNLWHQNPDLMEARGHVSLADGTVVIRPFTKIFNQYENGTNIDRSEWCLAVEKINGFMAAVTYVPMIDRVIVSTTGSLDSDFVTLAETYITDDIKDKIKLLSKHCPTTYLFEICHPDDPHIIDETYGAYLIGARRVDDTQPYVSTRTWEAHLDVVAQYIGVMRPVWEVAQFSEIVSSAKKCLHEGYVVYGMTSGTALKIKSPYYLTLKMAARRKDILSLNKQRIDEEFYPLIDHLHSLGDSFHAMTEQQRLTCMREFLSQ